MAEILLIMNSVYFLYNNLHLFDFRAFSKDVRIIPKRFSFTKKNALFGVGHIQGLA